MCEFKRTKSSFGAAAALFLMAAGFTVAIEVPAADAQDASYSAQDVVKHFESVKARSEPVTRALCIGTRDECAAKAASKDTTGQTASAAPGQPIPDVAFNMLVSFEYASARLSPTAMVNLREFAKGINVSEFSKSKFAIEGHTDGIGSDDYNQSLSEQRAIAVRSYLVSMGVDPSRLTTAGFGKTRPKVPDDKAPVNRRVESRMVVQQ